MSDIIARAKELLKDVTPGPWSVGYVDPDYPELQGAPQVENDIVRVPILLSDIYADFSPEDGDLVAAAWAHAKALAEETYEYTAQVHMYNRSWVYMSSPTSGNSVYGKWHPTMELAEKFADQWQLDYPIRIVRRRVSPVEVVDD